MGLPSFRRTCPRAGPYAYPRRKATRSRAGGLRLGKTARLLTGSTKGIQARHARKLGLILDLLDAASCVEDANFPGSRLHALKGDLAGYWRSMFLPTGVLRSVLKMETPTSSTIRIIIEGITMRESRTRRPSTPGAILKGLYLDPLDMTITGLAERLGVSRKTVSAIVNGRSPISVDMALRLSRAFSTTPELWLNMQRNVDLWDEQQAGGAWKNIVPVPMMDYAETPAGA